MPVIKKAPKNKNYGHAVVSSNVKNYDSDPYFVKKAEEAKETISKVGLPQKDKK